MFQGFAANGSRTVCIISLLLAASLPGALAQEESRRDDPTLGQPRIIEEIVVTAQKREEKLGDVPISMSVLDEAFIRDANITDLRDLSLYVPNVSIDDNSDFPNARIRGFGTTLSNKAFDQPVGLVIDGVPYSRLPYLQTALFDLDRVEVLRGPQGTLFGKNTTAGVVNVTTKAPSDEFTGSISAELGEFDRRRFEGAVGGPFIADVVNFRIAAITDERDGYVRNTTAAVAPRANDRMAGRDRKGVRVKLGMPNVLGGDVVFGYERMSLDLIGSGWELFLVKEPLQRYLRQWDPNVDFKFGNFVGSIDTRDFASRDVQTFVLNGSYDVGDFIVHLVAGHASLEGDRLSDNDISPAPVARTFDKDENPQTTAEVRVISPSLPGIFGIDQLFGFPLGSLEFTSGLFFQRSKIEDSLLAITLDLPVTAQIAAAGRAPEGADVPAIDDFIGPAVPIADLGVFDTTVGEDTTNGFFDQRTDSIASFGQLSWHFAERWTVQPALRLSQEWKDAHWLRQSSPGVVWPALGFENFTSNRSRSEFVTMPKVGVIHDWTDEISLFAAWAKGFRAGGFNEFAPRDDEEEMTFDTEKVTSWEIGAKMGLLGGVARWDFGLFRMDLTDFQVFTFDPTFLTPFVVNAGEVRAQGVESDFTWLTTDWLTVRNSIGFIDSEFIEFPFGPCPQDMSNRDGDEDPRCDLSGQPLMRTPKWSVVTVPSVRLPFAWILPIARVSSPPVAAVDLIADMTIEYQDVHYINENLEGRSRQPPFIRLNASIGLADFGRGWSVRVVGENLTDEAVGIRTREVTPSAGGLGKLADPSRNIFGVLRWQF